MVDEVIPTGLPGSNSFDSPNGTVLFPLYQSNDTIVSDFHSTESANSTYTHVSSVPV